MKQVNAISFAFRYIIAKALNDSLERDKKAIKEGAKITNNAFCKITIGTYSKKVWSKEATEKADNILESLGYEKQEVINTRINVGNISNNIDNFAQKTLKLLDKKENKLIIDTKENNGAGV